MSIDPPRFEAPEQYAAPDTVEWGSERVALPAWLAGRWRGLAARLLAAGGGIAMFASMVTAWQVIGRDNSYFGPRPGEEPEPLLLRLGEIFAWGPLWAVGAMTLAVCTTLTLFGQVVVRVHTRLAGLATAGVVASLLVAAAVGLKSGSIYSVGGSNEDLSLGPGVYLAFTAVALLAAALVAAPVGDDPPQRAWRRPRQRGSAGDAPGVPDQPADLTVTAEPLSEHPIDRPDLR